MLCGSPLTQAYVVCVRALHAQGHNSIPLNAVLNVENVMAKTVSRVTSVSRNGSVSGGERAAAALDRSTWLNWQPSRGFQLKEAMINACLAYNGVHPITKRVSMNVR